MQSETVKVLVTTLVMTVDVTTAVDVVVTKTAMANGEANLGMKSGLAARARHTESRPLMCTSASPCELLMDGAWYTIGAWSCTSDSSGATLVSILHNESQSINIWTYLIT